VNDHRRFRSVGLALAVVWAISLVGCSSSRDIEADEATGTTIRDLGDDSLVDDEGLVGGSQAAAEIQRIVDRLLASNDACAILSQKDLKGMTIDPTSLASSAARRTLAQGVLDVYDHLVRIIPDASIKPALQTQQQTFVQVLEVVERYTANPTSKEGNDQIQALVTDSDFVTAESTVSAWTYQNCS